jgi:hypothetical protein
MTGTQPRPQQTEKGNTQENQEEMDSSGLRASLDDLVKRGIRRGEIREQVPKILTLGTLGCY